MRTQFTGRKRTSAAAGILLALAVAGGAFAYWTISGSGSGSASAAAGDIPISVVETSAVSGLYPGGNPQTLEGYFDNRNTSPMWVTSLSVAVVPTWADGTCGPDDFVFNGPLPVNAYLPFGTTNWTGLTIAMANLAENQNDCKGVAVPLEYTVNP